jgi:uncharacterized membrane protein YgcG
VGDAFEIVKACAPSPNYLTQDSISLDAAEGGGKELAAQDNDSLCVWFFGIFPLQGSNMMMLGVLLDPRVMVVREAKVWLLVFMVMRNKAKLGPVNGVVGDVDDRHHMGDGDDGGQKVCQQTDSLFLLLCNKN